VTEESRAIKFFKPAYHWNPIRNTERLCHLRFSLRSKAGWIAYDWHENFNRSIERLCHSCESRNLLVTLQSYGLTRELYLRFTEFIECEPKNHWLKNSTHIPPNLIRNTNRFSHPRILTCSEYLGSIRLLLQPIVYVQPKKTISLHYNN